MKIASIRNLLALLMLSTVFSTISYAQQDDPMWNELMKHYHETKLEKFSAEKNLAGFEAYLALHPNQPLTQLYTASSYCFIARDAWMPWNKMTAANSCIDKMEVGLANAQQHYASDSNELLNSYLTFGLTSASLPDRFQQKEISKDILNKAKNHPRFSYLPENLQQQVISRLTEFKQ